MKGVFFMEILKVSSHSNPSSVAGAIYNAIREAPRLEINTVGAGALNQAIKAVAIARGFLAPIGIQCVCIPSFMDVEINGCVRTAIKMIVEKVE